jgi:hypothetical protein
VVVFCGVASSGEYGGCSGLQVLKLAHILAMQKTGAGGGGHADQSNRKPTPTAAQNTW